MEAYRFIVNPKSGAGKALPRLTQALHQCGSYNESLIFTTHASGHAGELAQECINNGIKRIMVVGGDGTLNEVAAVVANTDTELALIPSGSGNGLARHCHIPLKMYDALQLALKGNANKIDTLLINNRRCVNVAGIGFDAMIAHRFNSLKKRGHLAYIRTVAMAYPAYKPQLYKIKINDEALEVNALFISLANSSQFGNNVSIAPGASLCDGLMDVCIFAKIPLWQVPQHLLRLYRNKINKSSYVTTIQANSAIIEASPNDKIHIDGEPAFATGTLHIRVDRHSLKLVTPPNQQI